MKPASPNQELEMGHCLAHRKHPVESVQLGERAAAPSPGKTIGNRLRRPWLAMSEDLLTRSESRAVVRDKRVDSPCQVGEHLAVAGQNKVGRESADRCKRSEELLQRPTVGKRLIAERWCDVGQYVVAAEQKVVRLVVVDDVSSGVARCRMDAKGSLMQMDLVSRRKPSVRERPRLRLATLALLLLQRLGGRCNGSGAVASKPLTTMFNRPVVPIALNDGFNEAPLVSSKRDFSS